MSYYYYSTNASDSSIIRDDRIGPFKAAVPTDSVSLFPPLRDIHNGNMMAARFFFIRQEVASFLE
jgi:hypothetical protein